MPFSARCSSCLGSAELPSIKAPVVSGLAVETKAVPVWLDLDVVVMEEAASLVP